MSSSGTAYVAARSVTTPPGAPYIVAPDGRRLLITQAAPHVHRGQLATGGAFVVDARRDADVMISAIVPVLTDNIPTGEIVVTNLSTNREVQRINVAAAHHHIERMFSGKLRVAVETSAAALTELSERIIAYSLHMPESIAIAEHSMLAVMRQTAAAWHELVAEAFAPIMQLPLHSGPHGCLRFEYSGKDQDQSFPIDVYMVRFATAPQ